MNRNMHALSPFFEDNYREIHVRAYAKISKLSPPTASKILKTFSAEGILNFSHDKGHNIYVASKNEYFSKLQQLYWYEILTRNGFLEQMQRTYLNCPIILFGSIAKAEARADSDIDIAIIGSTKKCDTHMYEKKMNRKIHIMLFESAERIPSNLRNAISNGYVLARGIFNGLE